MAERLFDADGEPTPEAWARVNRALSQASAVEFDGCHKIYILLDADEARRRTARIAESEHSADMRVVEPTLEHVKQFYTDSCFLRFVSAVLDDGESNHDYIQLIPQYFEDEDYPLTDYPGIDS